MVIETVLFATALFEVVKILAEKAVVEPALKKGLEGFQARLTREYDQAKAREEWIEAMLAALKEMREKEGGKFPMLRATLNLTGLRAETQRLLVSTAVSMARAEPRKIPVMLLTDLNLIDSDRAWLAVYLAYLRRNLAGREFYQPLIAYADNLEQHGLLDGISKEMEQVAENTLALASYVKLIAGQWHLTGNDEKALEKYLDLGRKDWGGLMLPMIRHRVDDGRSYRLKQIFVPLLLQDKRAEEQVRKNMERLQRKPENLAREEDEKTRPVGFTELMTRYTAFVLIGKPGSGKTTLFRRAALAFAEGRAAEELGWKGRALFPIFIRLRNFGEFLKGEAGEHFCDPAPGALLEYLKNRYQNGEDLDLTPDFFSRRLDGGDCLVLLDGLDEVAQGRDVVAQQLNAFIKRFKTGNYFGISSRPGGYGKDEETALRAAQLARAEVAPLDAKGICQLIENLLAVMEWDNEREHQAAVQDLPRSILASSDLTSIASIPLFCSALVQVYKYNKAKLPERRVDVLDEIVTLLLGHWHASKADLDVQNARALGMEDGTGRNYKTVEESVEYKYRRLRYLAYHMHTVAKQYEVDAETARSVLSEYFMQKERFKDKELAESCAEGFLLNSHERSGLLAEMTAASEHNPATYAFIHQNFAEFLAATELVNRGGLVEVVLENIDDPWWEQVILFAGAQRGPFDHLRSEIILRLMEAASQQLDGAPEWERRLSMAGHLARDMGGHLDGGVREELEEVLRQAATSADKKPVSRANLADALDELWTPADLHAFVEIADDRSQIIDDRPSSTVRRLFFAKYPVTNAQYQRFLEADDYPAEKYWMRFPKYAEPEKEYTRIGDWGAAGYKWLQENWDERKKVLPRYWNDPRFGISRKNAPVVGISWYEANAYCKWLMENWETLDEGKQGLPRPDEIRLPIESEWILAAGGTNNNRFAFGELKDGKDLPRYANTDVSSIRRTTPVWMYPAGATPDGLMDMSGNVWELQVNYSSNSEQYLALRGGSWGNSEDLARVSGGDYDNPDGRRHFVGFRVVVLALPN
jgi:formylglycine-generating enzyme required for sulfatase activity